MFQQIINNAKKSKHSTQNVKIIDRKRNKKSQEKRKQNKIKRESKTEHRLVIKSQMNFLFNQNQMKPIQAKSNDY